MLAVRRRVGEAAARFLVSRNTPVPPVLLKLLVGNIVGTRGSPPVGHRPAED